MSFKAIAVILAVLVPLPAFAAQPPPSHWSVVMSVPEGSRLIVRLRDGRQYEGPASEIAQHQLVIEQRRGSVEILPADVRTIELVAGRSRGRSALIAAGAAAAIGAALSAGFSDGGVSRAEAAVGGAIGMGLFGAPFGWIGSSRPVRVLIYEAS